MKTASLIYNFKEILKLDFIPNLAFLFFEGHRKEVMVECYNQLIKINPNMEIIGINGKGGNINNSIPFITNETQISMLIFEQIEFFIEISNINNMNNLKTEFINNYNSYKETTSILFFPFEYDINYFLDYIQDDKNMHNIYGGVYDIDNNIGCFYNGNFYQNKLISIFFNQEKIEFFSISLHGWKPIGISFKVTKTEKNIVYELDNQPALEVLEEYMGRIIQKNIDSFLHPFCVKHKTNISLASMKEINRKNKSIKFFKYIYEGESIKITIPVNQHTMMNLIEKELKNIECDGLFMFSCVGRYAYYKDLVEFEIAKVAECLKVPFAGFLTFGEIGSNSIHTKSILQNQTMNLVFFKGKK